MSAGATVAAIVADLRGRAGGLGGGFTSADDVADYIEQRWRAPEVRDRRDGERVGWTREPTPPIQQDAMSAVLIASMRVRNGEWINGAPSHVFAELLTELAADGWELRPASDVMERAHADAMTMVDRLAGKLEKSEQERDEARQARDHWIRLFNRLEKAVTDAIERNPDDDALASAHRAVMKDATG